MDIWKPFIGSLARVAIAWLFGILVSHSVISSDLAAKLTDSAVGYVVLFLLAVVQRVSIKDCA